LWTFLSENGSVGPGVTFDAIGMRRHSGSATVRTARTVSKSKIQNKEQSLAGWNS